MGEDKANEIKSIDNKPNVSQIPLGQVKEIFSLYIRGSKWIKDRENVESKLLAINPKIKNIRHPRQKSANYCYVDFESAAERDEAFEEMKDNSEIKVKPVTRDVPKLLEKRIQKLAEKREASRQAKKALCKFSKDSKKEASNQVVISKLPRETTATELKKYFKTSIDINMKLSKKQEKFHSAIITFATPNDAKEATKMKINLHGTKLVICLNSKNHFRNLKNRVWKKQSKLRKLLHLQKAAETKNTTE